MGLKTHKDGVIEKNGVGTRTRLARERPVPLASVHLGIFQITGTKQWGDVITVITAVHCYKPAVPYWSSNSVLSNVQGLIHKMGLVHLLAATCCITYVTSTIVSPENIEMERFTLADSKNSRSGVSASTGYKTIRDNIAAPSSRQSNVVYGKSKAPKPAPGAYVAPHLKNKPVLSKFKPSQEDTGYDIEPINSYGHAYKPTAQETAAMQKYMQRYATQLLAASNSPKFSSDPYKKYASPSQKYKFIPVASPEPKPTGEKLKDHDTVEIGTEKTHTYQVHQHVTVQHPKVPKSPPKKAYSYDSSHQSSDYKYTSHDSQLASQLLAEPEKESWSHYEPYQYGVVSHDKSGELSKITGYKIPAATSISVGHSVETKEEEKHEAEEEHYPSHDPKYEYMYQVHDPEKHNNFGHSEARKGKTTWGRYYVQLPDGRLETVKYWVDKSGYHAEVDFKGEAKHPAPKEYVHHEEPKQVQHEELKFLHHEEPKYEPKYVHHVEHKGEKTEELGLGGHSETSYSLSEAVEEY